MTPGECPHEGKTLEIGNGVKSFCVPWDCWTNCREVGHCTKPHENQMTIFDLLDDESEDEECE